MAPTQPLNLLRAWRADEGFAGKANELAGNNHSFVVWEAGCSRQTKEIGIVWSVWLRTYIKGTRITPKSTNLESNELEDGRALGLPIGEDPARRTAK